jgi:hypothetical protein
MGETMPTSKPRITITLTEYQHAMLRRISDAGGRSMSGVISEFMMAAQPTLERMAYTFHQLKQDRDADHQRVTDMLLELHAERDQKNRTSVEADGVEMTKPLYPASAGPLSDSASSPLSDSVEAIQYCASVDTVRPDNPDSRDSPWNEVEINTVYEKRKNASPKTKRTKK